MTLAMAILSALISGAVIENLLFARALEADHIINRSRSYRSIFWYGIEISVVSCAAMLPLWGLHKKFHTTVWWTYGRSPIALLLIIIFHFLTLILLNNIKKVQALRFADIGATYSASFAILLLGLTAQLTLIPSVFYCLGASIGIVGAMILVHSGRERLELCALPRSFAGLPITMIYIGILSLAIYGLIGHQLPT